MAWQTVQATDQLWAGFGYSEALVSWGVLEQGLQIIPPSDDKGPPDFLLSVDGSSYLPLTKVAASQFGRLSGVRPAIYKEFAKNDTLTASMVHYSMNRPDRGGNIYVAYARDRILGFYVAEKPFLGVKDSYEILKTVPGIQYVDLFLRPDGVWELIATLGDLTKSVTPALYLLYGGRPQVGVYLILHDQSAVLGDAKPPKKRKSKESCEATAAFFMAGRGNEAVGEAEAVYNLASRVIDNPVRFLSRLALMNGFSSQASDQMVAGASVGLGTSPTQYDVVRYVAALANAGEDGVPDRRFQSFAHYVAFRGSGCCATCGLPT